MNTVKKNFEPQDQLNLKTEILNYFKGEEREQVLFSLSLEGSKLFGIYVKEGDESAMTAFDAEPEDAELLFGRINDGKLSAIHLNEAVEDFIKEKI